MENQKSKKFDGATFVVKMISQENYSWQGTITWVEENRSKNFRSVLELMKLMDSALPSDEDTTLS